MLLISIRLFIIVNHCLYHSHRGRLINFDNEELGSTKRVYRLPCWLLTRSICRPLTFFVNSKNLILRLNDRDEATRTCLQKKKEERTKEKERTRLVQSDNWKRPKRESGQGGWWIFQRGSRLRIMGRKRKGLCRGNSWKRTCRGFRFNEEETRKSTFRKWNGVDARFALFSCLVAMSAHVFPRGIFVAWRVVE